MSVSFSGDDTQNNTCHFTGTRAVTLWQGLLGRPASESGSFCRGDRARGAADAAGGC